MFRLSRPATIAVLPILLAATAAMALAKPRGDDAQRPSKNGRTAGSVGGAGVVIEYGRPNVNGRPIWGALVPWGQVWRTGANEATTIAFDRDVTIDGQKLAAGTYALFTLPTEKSWTVIFNRTAEQWGAFKYDASQDALRVTVEPAAAEFVESLEFSIQGDKVVMRWEKLRIEFRVAAAG